MAKLEIALDIGTSYTSVFVSGGGVVLCEPTVIAYFDNGGKRTVRAVGKQAYEMMGRAPDKTKIVCPVTDGAIKDADACADMLSEFIKKLLPASYVFKPHIRCIVGVPIGISLEERETYEDVLLRAGVDESVMVNSIMLAAIGAELPVTASFGGFLASVGGGATEIAVISLCGITAGCGVTIGGEMIDRALTDLISGKYRLGVGRGAVRRIKESICSLVRNDCASATVSGIDLETKNIRSTQVLSADLFEVVYAYYSNIADAVASLINTCSPTIAAEIQRSGIMLVGGGARIPGLTELFVNRFNLRARVAHDARYSTVLGGGKLLSDDELLDNIIQHS